MSLKYEPATWSRIILLILVHASWYSSTNVGLRFGYGARVLGLWGWVLGAALGAFRFGFRVSGFGFRVSVSGFGFRFRVSGFGFRVSGLGPLGLGVEESVSGCVAVVPDAELGPHSVVDGRACEHLRV